MMSQELIEVPEALETERLLLRCPRAGDGAALNAAIRESWAELRPWMDWAQSLDPVEQTEVYMRQAGAEFIVRKAMRYLLFLKSDGTLVGSSGLHNPDWKVPSFEIGYWVHTRYAGKGYITEAVLAQTQMAFNVLGARRVQLVCDAANVRSAAVARRCGFQLEGVLRNASRKPGSGELRDDMIFSLVRPDP